MILAVTGGSGSLGRAILEGQERLASHGIKKIRILSRDEQKQVYITRNYKGSIPLDCYLADVSDKERMSFALNDVNYVIHAAAQKHIEKFELDVKTGYKTNIHGTENVAQGFLHSKEGRRALFVSTDKAAVPITAYGVSKLAAEHIWCWHNSFQKQKKFLFTRSGNVFGSRGSVIETWTALSKRGAPLPITDPSCTRFFMTIKETAEFVIHTLFFSNEEKNIPSCKGTKMLRLAEIIWKHWNPEKPFEFKDVGYRSIEKQHEILLESGQSSNEVEQFTDKELKALYENWLSQERIML